MGTELPGFRWVNKRDCSIDVQQIGFDLHRYFPSKLTRQLKKYMRDGNHAEVVNLSINPFHYTNPDQFRTDYLACEILSKYDGLNLGIDTEAVALRAFAEAEFRCAATNATLRAAYGTPTLGVSGDSLIERARLKIMQLLQEFCWDKAADAARFSSGASATRNREAGDPFYKYQAKPEVTRDAFHLGVAAVRSTPVWRDHIVSEYGPDPRDWFEIVPGNVLCMVDKNAKTKRVIAKEPSLNMYLQLGIGRLLRKALRKVGINLNDQGPNQLYAKLGSLYGTYATLDLKQASDHLCYELVRRLLPPDWFAALVAVRSHEGVLPNGMKVLFEKFSSMGNGYTFELESLIFWALSSSVVEAYTGPERRVLVYGDDIIVPSAAAGFVSELLLYVGFPTNDKKSFSAGPFRESCGKHYFNGVDVSPFYVRKSVVGNNRIYWLCNSIRYWGAAGADVVDARASRWYRAYVSQIPVSERLKVPPHMGYESGLISSFHEAAPRWSRKKQCWSFRYVLRGVGSYEKHYCGAMYLRAMQRTPGAISVPPDGRTYGYTKYADDIVELRCKYELHDDDFSEQESRPNDELLIDRKRRWVRIKRAFTPVWHEAPLLCA